MAEIYGRTFTRRELLERMGSISQMCDARMMRFEGGRADGVRTIEVSTGSGLAFTVVPSRGMDISRASFCGTPLAWQSAVGEASPHSYQPEGMEWLKNFFGGLLTTCGLSYASHPCEDDGESLGLHGRASNIPADNVHIDKFWDGDEYRIVLQGDVREVGVFGHNLVMHRTIETSLGSGTIRISDTIRNEGFRESPLMMLYHINPGWPLLSETSRLYAPVRKSTFFDNRAKKESDMWSSFQPPENGYEERCYLHDMHADRNGNVSLAIVNESLDLGLSMRYSKKELPRFVQWKMTGCGEYVLGIEPGNITGNRAFMRKEGTLETLPPGAERRFTIKLGVLGSPEEITRRIEEIQEVRQ